MNLSSALGEALTRAATMNAATIELAAVISVNPLIIEHRGTHSGDGIGVLEGVSLSVGKSCVVAVFGAANRIVIGVVKQ